MNQRLNMDMEQSIGFAGGAREQQVSEPPRRLVGRGLVISMGVTLVAISVSAWFKPAFVPILAFVLLALALAAVLVRPQWALFVFVVGLPLHLLMMTFVFKVTGSVTDVKLLQPWKEIVLGTTLLRVAIPVAIGRVSHKRRVRFALLDIVLVAFVIICAVSVVLPSPLVPLVGRLYGFRDLVLPLSVYALGRLAPLTRREMKWLIGLLAADVGIFGLVALGERAFWGNWLPLTLGYGNYIRQFLGLTFPLPNNMPYTFYTGSPYWLPRAASLTLGPLDLSILMMIGLPILLAVMGIARREGRWRETLALGVATLIGGAALVLAWGRASLILIGVALVLLVALGGIRWQWPGIVSFLVGCALGSALLLAITSYVVSAEPDLRIQVADQGLVALSTHSVCLSRECGSALISQSTSGQNDSTKGHIDSLRQLVVLMVGRPQGYGIGVAGQVGVRFHTGIGAEDSYLSVGVELGALGLLLYAGAFAGAIFVCWRAARSRAGTLERALFLGTAIAWLIIAMDGVIAEVTLNMFAMYLLWWMAGMAVTTIQQHRVVFAPGMDGAEPQWSAARPLRVAMDAQCLQTASTGVRTYVDQLLRQFGRPETRHVVVPLRGPQRLPSNVRVFRMINQVVYMFWLHVWLPMRLSLGNFDVLFSPEYMMPIWAPVASVVMMHDTLFLLRPQDYNRLWLWFFRRVTLPAIRRADAVIVPSEYTARDIGEHARVRRERIHVVPEGGPTGVESSRGDSERARDTLARYRLDAGAYVLHVGVLERRKNLVTLIKAFAQWREQGGPSNWNLVLVGQAGPRPDLDDSRQIRQAIADLALDDAVLLTGHVSAEERDILYAHAGVVAIPSVFEGFGLPVLEAFAAHAPVVVARATSLPEVAGDAALYFDPAESQEIARCLAQLDADPALRARLVQAGAERMGQFTWARTAEGTLRAFEAAVVQAYAPAQMGRRGQAPAVLAS